MKISEKLNDCQHIDRLLCISSKIIERSSASNIKCKSHLFGLMFEFANNNNNNTMKKVIMIVKVMIDLVNIYMHSMSTESKRKK